MRCIYYGGDAAFIMAIDGKNYGVGWRWRISTVVLLADYCSQSIKK